MKAPLTIGPDLECMHYFFESLEFIAEPLFRIVRRKKEGRMHSAAMLIIVHRQKKKDAMQKKWKK